MFHFKMSNSIRMEVIVMKLLRLGSATVLSLLLWIAAPAYAQETPEHQERQEQKPDAPDDHAQPPRAQQQPKDEQKQEDQTRKNDGQRNDDQRNEDQRKEDQQAAQSKNDKRDVKSSRIPDDRFRANYGRQHVFHVSRVTVVNGAPRFAYGGYTFVLVNPWPASWYYTDDCYIDYVDGEYFLFDLLHPGVRIALTVVL
jgi:hypothetical protein